MAKCFAFGLVSGGPAITSHVAVHIRVRVWSRQRGSVQVHGSYDDDNLSGEAEVRHTTSALDSALRILIQTVVLLAQKGVMNIWWVGGWF